MKTNLGLALLIAWGLASASAHAGPAEDARVLFDIGAQAYEKGDYLAALEAFHNAYKLSPRQGLLFSIGQANRRQFFTGGKQREHLQAAIAAYKQYLAEVPHGGRRAEASEILLELESIAARMEPLQGEEAAPPPAITRLMVTTQIEGARISLDGQPPHDVPLVKEIEPGRHTVRVAAAGYVDETRHIEVLAGSVTPLDIPLRELPATLHVRAERDAQVSVDGRFVATTPLGSPIELAPGRHVISVLRNGAKAHVEEIEVRRGERRELLVNLERTAQRNVSYGLFVASAAGLLASGVLAAIAVHKQGEALDVDQDRVAGKVVCGSGAECSSRIAEYQSLIDGRDSYRTAAEVALGASVVSAGAGLALFLLDFPSSGGGRQVWRDDRQGPGQRPRERGLEISATPIIVQGAYGGGFRLVF